MPKTSYVTHTVGAGDTIQKIGSLYNVDWTKIVSVNGLQYPYVDATVAYNPYEDVDTVAKIGTLLVIPVEGVMLPVLTNGDQETVERYAFGGDLDIFDYVKQEYGQVIPLEIQGELTDNHQGDLKLSEGIQNLAQQLIIRLGTPVGALPLHPEFGTNINKYIGKRMSVETLTKIRLEVQESILRDFRVAGVGDVTVEARSGGVWVDAMIQPIDPYGVFRLQHLFEMG